MKNLTLITGGVRSGKSQMAERLAIESGFSVYYLATMTRIAGDSEQDDRIERHRTRRPNSWTTVECSTDLADAISDLPEGRVCCVIDCLSLFLTNLILEGEGDIDPYGRETSIMTRMEAVLSAMETKPDAQFIVVTNEVGWGVVPESALGRAFRDFLGMANQLFATASADVWLTCSGLPLRLK